jgi:hypothetical protein
LDTHGIYLTIDDYAEKLIRKDIERIRNSDDTDHTFKEYLERILPSIINKTTTIEEELEEEEEEDKEKEDLK